jgi:2-oxoglutarate dehydrogenase E1 component
MTGLDQFYGPNAGYVAELFERYQRDPESVDPATRAAFAEWRDQPPPRTVAAPPARGADVPMAAAAASLAQAIRAYGHLGARLDPLGSPPPGDPQLEAATHGLGEEDLARLPASVVGGPVAQAATGAREAIAKLRSIYSGTSGFEFGHITAPEERAWLFEAVEDERFRPPTDPIDDRWLLDRLTEVSAFERFLHRTYPGQTRFSAEGLGMMIPMLDELIDRAANHGTCTAMLGMAHRGRLNVLAHVLGKPYERILAEFEGHLSTRRAASSDTTDEGWTGDVKYHAGAERDYPADEQPGPGTGTVAVVMAPNPSHLEFVDPVVEGMTRAAHEDRRRAGPPSQDEVASLAVLIHGDASFPGQGVVAETLNLSGLPGYRTGGTIHLIANNQLGFTTDPPDDRSTLYASDLAKGFEIPVAHVNADDPVACLAAVRLAVAYRTRFRKDFLIDLIGYRRWGHNEGDEPAFTQPLMYEEIRQHPTVRELFAADLARRGVVQPDAVEAMLREDLEEFQHVRESVLARANGATASAAEAADRGHEEVSLEAPTPEPDPPPQRAVPVDELRALNDALLRFPEGFNLNPKLDRALRRRREAFASPDAPIDWGHAETLAFATILRDGTPIRLTGQDTVRGTFSQRHLAYYDTETGEGFTPLAALPDLNASFDVRNSPLSENATLGFEYGYSVQAPDALVLWEAQYGDFINGAQVIVDEFVVSGQAKWGLRSGLVLLLPHAWEGQGPDHSGGRLERFLALAAEDNIRIANCTTAAQYFLLLRRQAASLRADPRPLVVMTPKSLLRHPLAASRASDLAREAFRPVLDDARASGQPDRVRRLVLCSGKVWADVESDPGRADDDSLALVRLEELYPFPAEELRALLESYSGAHDVVWLQEEPQNAGAWPWIEPRLRELLGSERSLRYVGRPERASPAEGWSDVHAVEQRRIVDAVLEPSERPAASFEPSTAQVSS